MSMLEHYAHMMHLMHEKHKHERMLEEKHKRLDKIKVRLRSGLDGFLKGRNVKISGLSREFMKQAVVVDEEKKKLDFLKTQLDALKNRPFQQRQRANSS